MVVRPALRTRLLAAALVRTPGIESGASPAEVRSRREALQAGAFGRWLFGRIDPAVEVSVVSVPADHGLLRALVYRRRDRIAAAPTVLNLHGGGWTLGAPEQSGWLSSRVAAATGAVVVAPSYRLAPEHPYPAAVDDAWRALEWVAGDGRGVIGGDGRIAVMGDSAGGNLAAVLALRARDRGGPAITAQILVYPAVEMYDVYPSEVRYAAGPVLTSAGMRRFVELYLGERHGTLDHEASPLRADRLDRLPPALIVGAAHDPIADHGHRYRDALVAAGVPVEHSVHDRAVHGFLSLPGAVPQAREAADRIGDYLVRTFAAT